MKAKWSQAGFPANMFPSQQCGTRSQHGDPPTRCTLIDAWGGGQRFRGLASRYESAGAGGETTGEAS
jgi:hypothetical protein